MIELGRAVRAWNRDYGPQNTLARVREALGIADRRATPDEAARVRSARKIDPMREVRLGGLAEGLLGHDWQSMLSRPVHALEATEAVDASAFTHITGQLLVTIVQEQYQAPEFIGDQLVDTVDEPAPVNLGEHKVPMVSQIIDGPSLVEPTMPYPMSKMVEDWVSYPAVGKFGEIMNVSLEAVMADRTGQIQDTAAKLGYRARYELEEDQLSVVLGLTNNFSWKGTSYNTYLSSGSNWINKTTGNTVAGGSYDLINTVEQLFAQMTDPYTSQVIAVNPTGLLCMPESKYDFKNILRATTVRIGAFATSSPNRQGEAPNPLDVEYPLLTSKIARALLVASGISSSNVKNYFYMADWKKAFVYRQIMPWTVIEAPPGNEADFQQDIVMRIKCRRMGKTGVKNPRYAAQSIGS